MQDHCQLLAVLDLSHNDFDDDPCRVIGAILRAPDCAGSRVLGRCSTARELVCFCPVVWVAGVWPSWPLRASPGAPCTWHARRKRPTGAAWPLAWEAEARQAAGDNGALAAASEAAELAQMV